MSTQVITHHLAAPTDRARVILSPGKLTRLPEGAHTVRVLAGHAWITHEGRDIVLDAGDECLLTQDKDFALASAVGDAKLVLEIRRKS